MRRSVWWAAAGLPFLILTVVLVAAPAFLVGNLRTPIAATPASVGIHDFEAVELRPADQPITVRGWWFPVADARGAFVVIHGGGDNRASPYAGILPLVRDLRLRGYAALAIDLRGHGESDDPVEGGPTFGPTEANDVVAAVDFVAKRLPGKPIAALGFSMGGNAVIYAGVKEPRIDAVITSGTYAELADVLPKAVSASTGVPAVLLYPVVWSAEAFWGVPVSWARAIDVAPRLDPGALLVIHNEIDPIVPREQAERLADAAPEGKLWITRAPEPDDPVLAESGPWGTHVRSYTLYPKQFVDRVVAHLAARARR